MQFTSKMSSESPSPQQTVNPSLTERQLSAIKVVKYLFISSLLLLIIGCFVLFCIAIDSIVNSSETIDTIERFGITELAVKRSEHLKKQSNVLFLIPSIKFYQVFVVNWQLFVN